MIHYMDVKISINTFGTPMLFQMNKVLRFVSTCELNFTQFFPKEFLHKWRRMAMMLFATYFPFVARCNSLFSYGKIQMFVQFMIDTSSLQFSS